ncbi:flagellar biosynthesis protein FlhB [Sphingorhabdus sp. M41]|uniref:flagellar biosynthesis protein FlhB n=1 Tax=Sphingorhabdus sp. M41 TaxID=1806885 RepID=UPI00078DD0B5|nr:flagellar biosynthesis protein FlhB [Sphingorhabdus sp. M41]AMO72616.1 flagellar biosynthetic protein FlhB [Sphingorhabdus sp. M41]
MASQGDAAEKTFDPTDRKLAEARKKGEVASAPEMRHATMFCAMVAVLATGGWSLSRLLDLCAALWGGAEDVSLDAGSASLFAGYLAGHFIVALTPILITLMVFALLTLFLQGRPTLAFARLKPNWKKFSPMDGAKRLFGLKALVEFAKTLAKLVLVIAVTMFIVWPKASELGGVVGAPPEAIGRIAHSLLSSMLQAVALLAIVLAIADFAYQRRTFLKKMMMSLQEVKDESKDSDGNPQIKQRIRQIAMEQSRHRMMSDVPTATVIVTNPTHFAVALKYDHDGMAAPVVVAKGVDAIALRIRAIASEARVPIVESPPLARALHAQGELGRPIPVEHYAAVAEIISYVLKLAAEAGRR